MKFANTRNTDKKFRNLCPAREFAQLAAPFPLSPHKTMGPRRVWENAPLLPESRLRGLRVPRRLMSVRQAPAGNAHVRAVRARGVLGRAAP